MDLKYHSCTQLRPFHPRRLSFMFANRGVAILFVDALQRMFRITAEVEAAKSSGQGMQDVRTETSFAARKF
jgi:B-cell receptor-associated protein 31